MTDLMIGHYVGNDQPKRGTMYRCPYKAENMQGPPLKHPLNRNGAVAHQT